MFLTTTKTTYKPYLRFRIQKFLWEFLLLKIYDFVPDGNSSVCYV